MSVATQHKTETHANVTIISGATIATARYASARWRFDRNVCSRIAIIERTRISPPITSITHASRARAAPVARFIVASTSNTPATATTRIPIVSTACGGLRILTSSPYALCHQLSNGAETTIVAAPHAPRNAPTGPRKPHTPIETGRCGADLRNVVANTSTAPAPPARMPPAWISRCAGVQNESRPIVMCHEMSQYVPATMHETDASETQTNQGMRLEDPVMASHDARRNHLVQKPSRAA